jgi:hypothetical protein
MCTINRLRRNTLEVPHHQLLSQSQETPSRHLHQAEVSLREPLRILGLEICSYIIRLHALDPSFFFQRDRCVCEKFIVSKQEDTTAVQLSIHGSFADLVQEAMADLVDVKAVECGCVGALCNLVQARKAGA